MDSLFRYSLSFLILFVYSLQLKKRLDDLLDEDKEQMFSFLEEVLENSPEQGRVTNHKQYT